MAYMRRIGWDVVALPHGGPHGALHTDLGDGLTETTLPTGETFRGRRGRIPGAAVQRRAMDLADAVGRPVVPEGGDKFSEYTRPMSGRTWQVVRSGAPGESHRRGWLVRVSEPVPGLGFDRQVAWFDTWPEVLGFISYHFGRQG